MNKGQSTRILFSPFNNKRFWPKTTILPPPNNKKNKNINNNKNNNNNQHPSHSAETTTNKGGGNNLPFFGQKKARQINNPKGGSLVAHNCGYPLSRYTCRATRVFPGFYSVPGVAPVALHPLKILVSHLPPPFPGGVAPKFGSGKVSRYTGVSQLQLRVSRYTVQLRVEGYDLPGPF